MVPSFFVELSKGNLAAEHGLDVCVVLGWCVRAVDEVCRYFVGGWFVVGGKSGTLKVLVFNDSVDDVVVIRAWVGFGEAGLYPFG